MSDNRVRYWVKDGFEPSSSNGCFELRAAMAFTPSRESYTRVNLGVSFEFPVLVWIPTNVAKRGLEFLKSPDVVPAGEDVIVGVINRADNPNFVERGEVIACCLPVSSVRVWDLHRVT